MIKRRKTKEIFVGDIGVGGTHPISVQSMTTTKTSDVDATLGQIYEFCLLYTSPSPRDRG